VKSLKCFIVSFFTALSVLFLCLCVSPLSAGAADAEHFGRCKQCGMSLTSFERSRVVIVYRDGMTAEVCSIHCAAAAMKENKEKQVESIMVADYETKKLIDGRTAIWVIGGDRPGGMNATPKWAFAREIDARRFVSENGGRLISFDDALKSASDEVAREVSGTAGGRHGHACHEEPGAQMIFNPAFGEDIYHIHPAGTGMVSYKFMHMNMNGLRDGTSDVSVDKVIPMRGTKYGYMMAPTKMSMDMHMIMVMYGITERLTAMAMFTYIDNRMDMLMNMGMRNKPEAPMVTSGFGDTELRGVYQISKHFVGSLGLSLPTGDIDKEFETMGMRFRQPYDMQLGSGTFDLKPAVTYSELSEDAKWNWGAQAMYTYHIGKNDNHYSLGDSFKLNGWLQRALGPVTSWVRLAFNTTGKIDGHDPEIQKLLDPMMGAPTPDADPNNYGGQRLDGAIGLSLAKGPVSLGVEAGIPLYQRLNGLQLKTDWFLTAGIQVMF
jgi:nitrous oxide reductase accessory protein NosL